MGKNAGGSAPKLLQMINKLYKIEKQAKHMSITERLALRQRDAKPVLDAIYKRANAINVLPKSAFGKALTYLLNQRDLLCEYLNHGEVNISN